MSGTLMTPIESLCITADQGFHPTGQPAVRCPQQQVKMIRHQAPGIENDIPILNQVGESLDEIKVVFGVDEGRLAQNSARDDMVNGVFEFDAKVVAHRLLPEEEDAPESEPLHSL